MEGSHGELRSRLANRLRGDRADGETAFDEVAGGHVHAVAAGTDASSGVTRQRGADLYRFDAEFLDLLGDFAGDDLVLLHDDFVRERIDDRLAVRAADDDLPQRDIDLLALVDGPLGNASFRTAVVLGDDDGLRHIVEFAGEVARVGRLERCIGQPLAGTVRGREVLKHVEPFAEVGANGCFDDFAAGFGHQTAHARELLHLTDVATSARGTHQEDRVEIVPPVVAVNRDLIERAHVAAIVLKRRDECLGEFFAAVRPDIKELIMPLPLGDRASAVSTLDCIDLLLRGCEQLGLVRRDPHVCDGD